LIAMGNKNSMFFYDIPHRTVIDKLEMPINLDYKNSTLKLNSSKIVDGYDMEEINLKANEDSGLILPGSKMNQKNKSKEIIEFDQLRFTPDGEHLCVVSNQGICMFTKKEM